MPRTCGDSSAVPERPFVSTHPVFSTKHVRETTSVVLGGVELACGEMHCPCPWGETQSLEALHVASWLLRCVRVLLSAPQRASASDNCARQSALEPTAGLMAPCRRDSPLPCAEKSRAVSDHAVPHSSIFRGAALPPLCIFPPGSHSIRGAYKPWEHPGAHDSFPPLSLSLRASNTSSPWVITCLSASPMSAPSTCPTISPWRHGIGPLIP